MTNSWSQRNRECHIHSGIQWSATYVPWMHLHQTLSARTLQAVSVAVRLLLLYESLKHRLSTWSICWSILTIRYLNIRFSWEKIPISYICLCTCSLFRSCLNLKLWYENLDVRMIKSCMYIDTLVAWHKTCKSTLNSYSKTL